MPRWSVYIDVEGFSATYEDGPQALVSLGSLMEGISFLAESHFQESPNRLFAHHIGDAFIIVSEVASESLEKAVCVASLLMRYVLARGGTCKASISEGDFADVTGCYPKSVQESRVEGGIHRIGRGIMTVFPVMGTALINAAKVDKRSPSGSLLLVDSSMSSRVPDQYRAEQVPDVGLHSIDWIHADSEQLKSMLNGSGLTNHVAATNVVLMREYIRRNRLKKEWIENTQKYLGL